MLIVTFFFVLMIKCDNFGSKHLRHGKNEFCVFLKLCDNKHHDFQSPYIYIQCDEAK